MKARSLLLWSALFLLLAPASRGILMSYSFFQGGYDDGAFISGGFNVTDLNGDGVFTGPLEVGGYSARFSGSTTIPFFITLSGLGVFSFFYNPTTNDLVLSTESSDPGKFEDISITHGLGSVTYGEHFFMPPFFSDSSTAPVVVTLIAVDGVRVPDSGATLALLALSLLGLMAFAHLLRVHGLEMFKVAAVAAPDTVIVPFPALGGSAPSFTNR